MVLKIGCSSFSQFCFLDRKQQTLLMTKFDNTKVFQVLNVDGQYLRERGKFEMRFRVVFDYLIYSQEPLLF